MAKQLAIDLGTANSLVIIKNKGLSIQQPSYVAYNKKTKKILTVGNEAKKLRGKTNHPIVIESPLENGAITSYRLTRALLKHLINESIGNLYLGNLEVIVSIPAGLTSVEERAVTNAFKSLNIKKIHLVPEPIAASIGARIPIYETSGNMIINMGAGTVEIAVISLGKLIKYQSLRMSGNAIDEAIQLYIKEKYNLIIGTQMSELIKIKIGSAVKLDQPYEILIKGNDYSSGEPRSILLNSNDILPPIKTILKNIVNSVKLVLEKTPPELTSDIIEKGIILSGGTSKIKQINIFFSNALNIPVHKIENPLTAVVEGLAEILNTK